jgi:GNAT superfamily N-acetyltransferase
MADTGGSERLRAGLRVSVRPALPEDATGIAEVECATWRATYAGLLPQPVLDGYLGRGRSDSWRRLIAARRREVVFVAADEQGAVGFASCGRARDPLCRRAGFDVELYTLYVLPDWQGRRIGARLFEEICGCVVAGARRHLLVWMLKGGPADGFYRKLGGRRLWERPGSLLGARLTEVAFGWRDLG